MGRFTASYIKDIEFLDACREETLNRNQLNLAY